MKRKKLWGIFLTTTAIASPLAYVVSCTPKNDSTTPLIDDKKVEENEVKTTKLTLDGIESVITDARSGTIAANKEVGSLDQLNNSILMAMINMSLDGVIPKDATITISKREDDAANGLTNLEFSVSWNGQSTKTIKITMTGFEKKSTEQKIVKDNDFFIRRFNFWANYRVIPVQLEKNYAKTISETSIEDIKDLMRKLYLTEELKYPDETKIFIVPTGLGNDLLKYFEFDMTIQLGAKQSKIARFRLEGFATNDLLAKERKTYLETENMLMVQKHLLKVARLFSKGNWTSNGDIRIFKYSIWDKNPSNQLLPSEFKTNFEKKNDQEKNEYISSLFSLGIIKSLTEYFSAVYPSPVKKWEKIFATFFVTGKILSVNDKEGTMKIMLYLNDSKSGAKARLYQFDISSFAKETPPSNP